LDSTYLDEQKARPMKTLNDLYLYEIILLFLGIFLFLILSAGLIYYIIKKEEFKKLLYFFPVAILMIAYPSIKEIQINNHRLELASNLERFIDNPSDSTAYKNVKEYTQKLESRANTKEDYILLSKSYLALENPEKAIKTADRATKVIQDADAGKVQAKPNEEKTKPSLDQPKLTNDRKEIEQLKVLAEIQDQKVKGTLTDKQVSEKLENAKLNPELTKMSTVIKRQNLNLEKVKK